MSTVTVYTLTRTLVDDLARLESGGTTYFFMNPGPGYSPIIFPLSKYVLSGGGSSSVVQVRKRLVS